MLEDITGTKGQNIELNRFICSPSEARFFLSFKIRQCLVMGSSAIETFINPAIWQASKNWRYIMPGSNNERYDHLALDHFDIDADRQTTQYNFIVR